MITKQDIQDLSLYEGVRNKNSFILFDSFSEIVVFSKDIEYRIIVDIDDLQFLLKFKWCLDSCGYPTARCIPFQKTVRMHELLYPGIGKGLVRDHVTRNKLDNRKSKIEIKTPSNNSFNSDLRSNNKSGYPGVFYREDRDRWIAYIKINYNRIHLGSFKDKELAVQARKNAERKYLIPLCV